MAKINGTNKNDRLRGTDRNDTLYGRGGDDLLFGGSGDDILSAGPGADRLIGGAGDDTAVFTDLVPTEADSFTGGSGNDTLNLRGVRTPYGIVQWDYDEQTSLYSVTQWGDPVGTPLALTFTGVETLLGGYDTDDIFLYGSTASLTIDAGGGSDWVIGGSGDDTIMGGVGNDRLDGGGGRNRIYGGVGDDEIRQATRLADGGDGNDTLAASGDVDLLRGHATGYGGERIQLNSIENLDLSISFGASADIVGSDTANVIENFLGGGVVNVRAGKGSDTITGGDGTDTIFGEQGNDILDGAFGSDTLKGGRGADTFVFADDFFISSRTDTGIDLITDFSRREGDRIDVSGVDANRTTPDVDEAFRFIGSAAFAGQAGELRTEVRGGVTVVQGDTDGDGVANLEFHLTGAITLHAADFVLG